MDAKRSKVIVAARPEGEIQRRLRVKTPVRRSSERVKRSVVPVSSEKRSSPRCTVNGSQSGALASSVTAIGTPSNTPCTNVVRRLPG